MAQWRPSGGAARRAGRAVGALLLAVLALPLVTGQVAARQPSGDVTVAPATRRSEDGRSVTDGVRTLGVSVADGLNPDGQTITVVGTGYDESKGIYVAFCLVPPPKQVPGPCGGGVDLAGATGASSWISSNPPSYGRSVAQPYGPGGSFLVTMAVAAVIDDRIDCRQAQCAIVTRNDHTRTTDRSQDLFVPLTFGEPGVTPPEAEPPVVTAPPASTAPDAPLIPTTTLADDGRSVSDGVRRMTISTTAVSVSGGEVTVEGAGFDEAHGIYLALCAWGEQSGVGSCRAGSAGSSAWFSSAPPDYARDLAAPFEPGGAFRATLQVAPQIDADTDCREASCAVVARGDDASAAAVAPLALPVSFVDGDVAVAAAPSVSSGAGGRSVMPLVLVTVVVAVAVALSVPSSLRRRARKARTVVTP